MSKYADWAAAAKEGGALDKQSSGTFETATGRAPGARNVYDAKDTGFLPGLLAGLADDPETRLSVYASARFPDDPNATERYGLINGEPVFRNPEGLLMRENADFAQGLTEAGPAMTGATIGGLMGNAPGAALGAAGGEGFRRAVSALVNEEPQSAMGNAADMGGEALLNFAGWKAGDIIGGNIVDRRTAGDLARYSPVIANNLLRKAQEMGVSLTGAETSGLRSLNAKQRVLQNSPGESGDVMNDFYLQRTEQEIPAAMERLIGRQPDVSTVERGMQEAAEAEIAALKQARTNKSSPYYQAAEADDGVETESVVSLIDGKLEKYRGTSIGRDLSSVRQTLVEKRGTGDEQDILKTRIDKLHAAKLDLDRRIKNLQRQEGSAAGTSVRELQEVKGKLLDEMSSVSETYDKGRRAYIDASVPIEKARAGLIGEIQSLKSKSLPGGSGRLEGLAERLLSGKSNPTTILQARSLFEKQKPGLWDDVLAVYLRGEWERASKLIQAGNNPMAGANFAKALKAAPMQRNMRAAMGEDRLRAFNDMLDVLQATGVVRQGESITALQQEARRQFGSEAAPIRRAILKPLALREWYLDTVTDKYMGNLAKVITSPQALDKLSELRSLSPGSQKAMDIVSNAIVNAGAGGATAFFEQPPPPRLPGQ